MSKNEAEEKFEQYREYLLNETKRLTHYICVYKHVHKRQEDRLEIMNISPAFFQTIIDSLFSVIVLWVDKLFCEKSKRGLFNFLTFCQYNRNIFKISELKRRRNYPNDHWMLNTEPITYQTVEDDKQKIRDLDSLPSFKLRRDKFHAHFDKEYFFNRSKLGEDAPLKWPDIDQILETMKDIINRYSASYDGNVHRLEPLNIHDLDYLLDQLYQLKQKRCRGWKRSGCFSKWFGRIRRPLSRL